MMNTTSYDRYQDLLQDIFLERQRRNERYSLRAFAKCLGLSPAMLTGVLSKRKGLSLASAMRISETLKLSDVDAAYFCDLVVSSHARSKSERDLSKRRVQLLRNLSVSSSRKKDGSLEVLREDEIEYIKHWYHTGILEYVNARGRVIDLARVASDLDLSIHQIRAAMARLCKLDLIKKTSVGYEATGKRFTTSTDIPNEALREAHDQFLTLAKAALKKQGVEERDYSLIVVATNKEKLPEAKERIQKFRRELMAFLEDTSAPKDLYCVSMQMFNLIHSSSEAQDQ